MEKLIENLKELIADNCGGISKQLANVRDVVIYDMPLELLETGIQSDLATLNNVTKIIAEIENKMFSQESKKITILQAELEKSQEKIKKLESLLSSPLKIAQG
ncbi:hypothetical protein SAMN05444274_10688 [Mariniphaga anaerophila]|uniref:Uncharacterized protein n=1 Tax=Mariniphaga anaerophila TaxID=1484053 RepID=A0A1M5CEQ0_9BACT|nr:hypothetical protein [Mariniphaga anaerophila]SHF53160.1 hypothetical protein SAMN05444274_10688 [Mariniphaga anaerophila]